MKMMMKMFLILPFARQNENAFDYRNSAKRLKWWNFRKKRFYCYHLKTVANAIWICLRLGWVVCFFRSLWKFLFNRVVGTKTQTTQNAKDDEICTQIRFVILWIRLSLLLAIISQWFSQLYYPFLALDRSRNITVWNKLGNILEGRVFICISNHNEDAIRDETTNENFQQLSWVHMKMLLRNSLFGFGVGCMDFWGGGVNYCVVVFFPLWFLLCFDDWE